MFITVVFKESIFLFSSPEIDNLVLDLWFVKSGTEIIKLLH